MREKARVDEHISHNHDQERMYRELQDRFDMKVVQADEFEGELNKVQVALDRIKIDLSAKEDILEARNRQLNDVEQELKSVKYDYESEKLTVKQLEEKVANMQSKCDELSTCEARVREDLRTDRLKNREADEKIRRLEEALKMKDVEISRFENSMSYLNREIDE